MYYSDKLIARFKKYFKIVYNKELTNEQAEIYLDSLASLFLAIGKNRK